MRKKKPFSELVIGLFCIALGVAVFIAAGNLQKVRLGIGPSGFPKFIAIVLGILGLAQTATALCSGVEKPKFEVDKRAAGLFAAAVAMSVMYVMLVTQVGFLLLTPVLLIGLMVLFGERSPAGRLPISFPRSIGATPCFYNRLPGGGEHYLEGPKAALFPFGHGLSYTTFAYGEPRVEKTGKYDYTVTLDVTNTGAVDSDEVVQLYVRDIISSIVTPDRELRAFSRVHIPAGESRTVTLTLDFDSFKLLNARYEWVVEPGDFEIMIGASSTDIRRSVTIRVD